MVLVTGMMLGLSTPLRQVKPPAHCVVPPVDVSKNAVLDVVLEGSLNNAQVPPHNRKSISAVVGALEIVNVLFTVSIANTTVSAASVPVPPVAFE